MTEWRESWTFEQYIMHMVRTKQTKSPEFQTMIRIFGREKLAEIYRKNCTPRQPALDDEISELDKK